MFFDGERDKVGRSGRVTTPKIHLPVNLRLLQPSGNSHQAAGTRILRNNGHAPPMRGKLLGDAHAQPGLHLALEDRIDRDDRQHG